SRRRHTRFSRDWSSDVCSSDLLTESKAEIALIILILDIKAGLTESDASLLDLAVEGGKSVLVLANKVDKLNQSERHHAVLKIKERIESYSNVIDVLPFSARTKNGKEKLREVIERVLAS